MCKRGENTYQTSFIHSFLEWCQTGPNLLFENYDVGFVLVQQLYKFSFNELEMCA